MSSIWWRWSQLKDELLAGGHALQPFKEYPILQDTSFGKTIPVPIPTAKAKPFAKQIRSNSYPETEDKIIRDCILKSVLSGGTITAGSKEASKLIKGYKRWPLSIQARWNTHIYPNLPPETKQVYNSARDALAASRRPGERLSAAEICATAEEHGRNPLSLAAMVAALSPRSKSSIITRFNDLTQKFDVLSQKVEAQGDAIRTIQERLGFEGAF